MWFKEKEVIKMFPKAQRYNIGLLKKIKNYENTVVVFMGAGNIRKNIKTILNYT
jgi:UDP-N-acetylmuramate-alanine ligase